MTVFLLVHQAGSNLQRPTLQAGALPIELPMQILAAKLGFEPRTFSLTGSRTDLLVLHRYRFGTLTENRTRITGLKVQRSDRLNYEGIYLRAGSTLGFLPQLRSILETPSGSLVSSIAVTCHRLRNLGDSTWILTKLNGFASRSLGTRA